MRHYNRLTPAEAERLAILAEEMGEAIQIIGKILRHGYESYHPSDPHGPTNRQLLEREIADVLVAAEMLLDAPDLSRVAVAERQATKRLTMQRWLRHQKAATSAGKVEA